MEGNLTVDPKDAQDNKIIGILAYLGILVLVPIFAAKESPFARFHANQGLILFIASIALYIVAFILGIILVLIGPVILATLLYVVVTVGIWVFAVLGIINAAKGEMKELPIIGKYRIIK